MQEIIEGLLSNETTAGKISVYSLRKSGFTFKYLTCCVNEVIPSGKVPDSLKLSNIVPVHNKKSPTHKRNYKLVHTLPFFSKVFEKEIFD